MLNPNHKNNLSACERIPTKTMFYLATNILKLIVGLETTFLKLYFFEKTVLLGLENKTKNVK